MVTPRTLPVLILLASFATLAHANRWVRHYHERVARFTAENRGLPADRRHVVLVGDSLTEGWEGGRRTSRYLPSFAGRVLNRGIASDTIGGARGILNRMNASVFDTRPSHVVLHAGVNQLGDNGRGAEQALRDYESALRQIRARFPEIQIVVVSTTPVRGSYASRGEAIRRFNRGLPALAERYGARFLDLHARMRDAQGNLRAELTGDGIHYNDRGYAIYGRALEGVLSGGQPAGRPATTPTPAEPEPAREEGLRRGAEGEAVRELQRALNGAGATLEPDGDFGPATERAVRDFQRRSGLPATGVVDRATQERLTPALDRGARGAGVERLQRLLNKHGAKLKIDGDFGPGTEEALRAFQLKKGLPSSSATSAELYRELNRPVKTGITSRLGGLGR